MLSEARHVGSPLGTKNIFIPYTLQWAIVKQSSNMSAPEDIDKDSFISTYHERLKDPGVEEDSKEINSVPREAILVKA